MNSSRKNLFENISLLFVFDYWILQHELEWPVLLYDFGKHKHISMDCLQTIPLTARLSSDLT